MEIEYSCGENRREIRQTGVVEEVEESLTWERLEEAVLKEERYKKTLRIRKRRKLQCRLTSKAISPVLWYSLCNDLLKVLKHFQ